MTRENAKEILSASRPNGADDADLLVAQALQVALSDPDLHAWLEKERTMDLAIFAKMADFKVPGDLKEQILGQPKIVKVSFFRQPAGWAAAAALVLIMIGLSWTNFSSQTPTFMAFDNYQAKVVAFANGLWMLPHHSTDLKDIQEWLAHSDSPSKFPVPDNLAAMTAIGCRNVQMDGNNVSLICFKLRDGKTEAHLFVVARSMIENAPPEDAPLIQEKAGWSTASWSDARHVYIVASPIGPKALKELL